MDRFLTEIPREKIDGNLFFLPHLVLGDQLINQGLVNLFLEKFNKIVLVILESTEETLKALYSYTDKIIFYKINEDKEISPKYSFNLNHFNQFVQESDFYFYLQGSHNITRQHEILGDCFSKSFYIELGVNPDEQYNQFKLIRNKEREMELYNKLVEKYGENYVIVHQDKHSDFYLDINHIDTDLPIFYIGECDVIRSNNLLDFCLIFENAQQLHLMPSSIAILCDFLGINKNVYIHLYSCKSEWVGQNIRSLYKNEVNIIYNRFHISKFIRYNTLPSIDCEIIYDIPDKDVRSLYEIKKQINIKDGINIFVKTDLLDYFIQKCLPYLNIKFNLMTGISDFTPKPYHYDILLNDSRILKWVCTNNTKKHSKIYDYPIGFQETDRNIQTEEKLKYYSSISNDKALDVNSIYIPYHRDTNDFRKKMLNIIISANSTYFSVEKDKLNYDRYMSKLTQHKFCLVLRGNGIDVHRIYECILNKTYPIFVCDEYFPLVENLGFIPRDK
jgi:hypothetical protein